MTSLRAGRSYAALAQLAFALVLTAIVGLSLWWGFLREHAPMTARGVRVEADFSAMPNGPAPDHFDGGQPANVVSSSDDANDEGKQFRIQGGALTYQPTTRGNAAAFFSSPDLGPSVRGMGARFVFRPGTGTQGAIALVVSRGIAKGFPPMIKPLPINLVVTPMNWNISVSRSDSAPLEIIAADFFKDPLRQDGSTVYEVRLTIDGAQITVDLPGTHKVLSDPRFSEWQGSFATFELYSNNGATDSIGAFKKIWATGNKD
jgi:hypothetical protein